MGPRFLRLETGNRQHTHVNIQNITEIQVAQNGQVTIFLIGGRFVTPTEKEFSILTRMIKIGVSAQQHENA